MPLYYSREYCYDSSSSTGIKTDIADFNRLGYDCNNIVVGTTPAATVTECKSFNIGRSSLLKSNQNCV